jgi:hypothetical protein
MTISFTDRIKEKHAFIFATLLFIGQQLEHTDITFSMLTFAFIIISVIAYNAGRGLAFPSGAYIFFNATLTVILGVTFKIFLNDPGQSNLLAPNTTLLAYCLGMALMGVAAAASHRLRPTRALLPNLEVGNMRYAALGCLFAGTIVQYLTSRSAAESGSFASALHQLNYLPRMAIIFATLYQIDKSQGKSATNWMVWLTGAFIFFLDGIVGFSKEGLFAAPVTWLLTCILYRFRFNWKHITTIVVFGLFAQFVLVPFSQYGRRSRADATTGTSQAMALESAIEYLKDPLGTNAAYEEELSNLNLNEGYHFYTTSQPFLERLSMFSPDDALISYTEKGNIFGLTSTFASYVNIVPHFLWKDKPSAGFGNTYAHEIGILDESDTTTGISFSPVADAFHEASWFGVVLVFPPVIFLYFFITDSLTGSVRDSPYALLPIALSAHAAPEGMMTGAIYLQTYGAMLLIIIAFLAKNLLARITMLTMGGDRVRVFRTRDFILGAREVKPIPQPEAPRS